jgi:hypothetical protein
MVKDGPMTPVHKKEPKIIENEHKNKEKIPCARRCEFTKNVNGVRGCKSMHKDERENIRVRLVMPEMVTVVQVVTSFGLNNLVTEKAIISNQKGNFSIPDISPEPEFAWFSIMIKPNVNLRSCDKRLGRNG